MPSPLRLDVVSQLPYVTGGSVIPNNFSQSAHSTMVKHTPIMEEVHACAHTQTRICMHTHIGKKGEKSETLSFGVFLRKRRGYIIFYD